MEAKPGIMVGTQLTIAESGIEPYFPENQQGTQRNGREVQGPGSVEGFRILEALQG